MRDFPAAKYAQKDHPMRKVKIKSVGKTTIAYILSCGHSFVSTEYLQINQDVRCKTCPVEFLPSRTTKR